MLIGQEPEIANGLGTGLPHLGLLALACGWACATLAASAAEYQPPPVPPKAPGVLRVVCFGDSITGYRPLQPHLETHVKFSDLLQLMLEARLGEGKAEVLNSGWAGERTTPDPGQGFPGAVGRLQRDVLDLKPDIAVLLTSGNDHEATDEQRAKTRANLEKMARDLKAAGIRSLFLLYPQPLPDAASPEKAWAQLSAKNAVIAAVAQAAGHPVLDLDPPMQAAAKRQPRAELANKVDGVHLNPGGEIVFAKAIYAKLVELGFVK